MNNLVKVERNQKYGFVVSSRNVSVVVKRRHDTVLRDIEKILTKSTPQICGLFIKSEYIASNGKKNKEYLLLKDGVILYLFNVQGLYEEKMAYINEFNRMEQALKNPKREQTKLDFQEKDIIRTTWKGEPVIELVQLARYIHMTSDNLHFLTKRDKVTLRYEKLMEFRKENPRRYNQSVNAISILFKETVIAICKKYGIYEKYKDFINNYFRVDNRLEDKTPKVPVIRANFDKVDSKEEFLEDEYYRIMYENIKEAYEIENKIERIYIEELIPIYNQIEGLCKTKREQFLSPHYRMKYGRERSGKVK
ncbi:Rha family transcriptional regulator [Fusobacterium necrophorum]|uniref:Rha family transcriptional regulator n=1 Tax=Fusobacterium necrophorum TaxID=859 RepID=UPI00370E6097